MPTYEYECTKCGKTFELFQSIKEPPRRKLRSTDPKPCKCNASIARRISTGGGLIFKGSGFYLTDYRSESYKKAASAESGTGKESKETKDIAGNESKTASSSETAVTKAQSKSPKRKSK